MGGSKDEVHTHSYRCRSTDPFLNGIVVLLACPAWIQGVDMPAIYFDSEVDYDEDLYIIQVGNTSV